MIDEAKTYDVIVWSIQHPVEDMYRICWSPSAPIFLGEVCPADSCDDLLQACRNYLKSNTFTLSNVPSFNISHEIQNVVFIVGSCWIILVTPFVFARNSFRAHMLVRQSAVPQYERVSAFDFSVKNVCKNKFTLRQSLSRDGRNVSVVTP